MYNAIIRLVGNIVACSLILYAYTYVELVIYEPKTAQEAIMAKIIKVTYAEESSVRIADFQYVKPRVEFVATVGEDESYEEVLEAVVYKVKEKLKHIEKQIFAQYTKK